MSRVQLLTAHAVIPLIVFDGGRLPIKGEEEDARRRCAGTLGGGGRMWTVRRNGLQVAGNVPACGSQLGPGPARHPRSIELEPSDAKVGASY
jgi:hypothetical protein